MARILIAAPPEPRAAAEQVLAGHTLTCVSTLEEAEERLRGENFDLIFCTVMFDESRMLDLLRLAKSDPEWKSIPFVCARFGSQVLSSPKLLKAVTVTTESLGAAAFLDVSKYKSDPERRMRIAVEKVLKKK
jgi:CheY-like chemotaxis protein